MDSCTGTVFRDDSDWDGCKNALDLQDNIGAIVEMLPEDLSILFHMKYFDVNADPNPRYTFRIFSLITHNTNKVNENMKYFENHFIISSSYPELIFKQKPNVKNGEKFLTPRGLFSTDAVNAVYTIYKNDKKMKNPSFIRENLDKYIIKSYFGEISFDSGHRIMRSTFIVEIKRDGITHIPLSSSVANNPYSTEFNMKNLKSCDFKVINTGNNVIYNIGIVESISGEYSALISGKVTTFLNLLDYINELGGLLGTRLNPIVMNCKSSLEEVVKITNSLIFDYNVKIIIGLDE